MTTAIKEYVQYYTIIFRDNYEVDIPEQTYEAIKKSIEKWVYDIEINGWLYNLHFTNYKRIEPRKAKTSVEVYIMRIKDPDLKEYIRNVEKERRQNFPLKKPFASVEHLQEFISEYEQWKK